MSNKTANGGGSNYWPVIFWCYSAKNGVAWYKPSHAHRHDQMSKPYKKWITAHRFAERKIDPHADTRTRLPMNDGLPTYIPWVIEQKEKPDVGSDSTLRIRVERITINEVD